MFFKLFFLLIAVSCSVHQTEAATDKVICFFGSWAGYRTGDGSFKPTHIDPTLCTHVYYAFLGANNDGTLQILDPWNEVDLGGLQSVNNLKQINPNLKTLISIGGWNAGHDLLTGIVGSSTLRQNLINSCISFFQRWGYDGIDIDWQYPTGTDTLNFIKLLQEMKTAFHAYGYILSVTVSPYPLSVYDIPEMTKVVDLINMMTYDYHTSALGTTGLNTPLYGDSSVNSSVHYWLGQGADAGKLTLSVAFYGYSFILVDATNNSLGAYATIGIAGPYTQNPGTLGYNEICAFYGDWTRVWNEEGLVPYSYDSTNWLSYDNAESVGLKAKYAKDNGLAGVAVWSIDTDDFRGVCGTQYPLLKAIKNNIDSLVH